jgi:hypothetical protein
VSPFTVEEVVGSREWEGSYGKNVDWTLALVGVPEQVRLTQKPETPAPKAGDELDVTLEDFPAEQIAKFGALATMKKAVKPKTFGGGGGFGGGAPRQEDPARSRAIQRMWSLDHAMQLLRLGFDTNTLTVPPTGDYKALWELVIREADRLDKDVDRARAGS